jgi:predicted DsbA family dithiol-disulfide isomerase
MTARVRTMIEAEGFVYAPPDVVPNASLPLELAETARDRGVFHEVHGRLFRTYWSEGRDIGDRETLLEIGVAGGLAPEEVTAALDERPHRERIRATTAGAFELGIGAVPAWVLDESVFVSGARPEEVFERAMERLGHRPIEPAPTSG